MLVEVDIELVGADDVAQGIERRLHVAVADGQEATCLLEEVLGHLEGVATDGSLGYGTDVGLEQVTYARELAIDGRGLSGLPEIVEAKGRGYGAQAMPGLEEIRHIGLIAHAGLERTELPRQRPLFATAVGSEDLSHTHTTIDEDTAIALPEAATAFKQAGLVVTIAHQVEMLGSDGLHPRGLCIG